MERELKVVYLPTQSLIPYDNNPRSNDGAVDAVAESISQYGWKRPIVIDSHNVIICGHTRLKAAVKLGQESVPCVIADDLTEAEARALRIADNRTNDLSIWENKLLLAELEEIGPELFTGFELGSEFESLNTKDNQALKDNDAGVVYQVTFKSEDEAKIRSITETWERMTNGG